jgi:hypothetical protein
MSRTAAPCPDRINDGSSSASLRIERRFYAVSVLNTSGGSQSFGRNVA